MTEYDLELIIDKEGTEGLAKVYSSLSEEFLEKQAKNRLGFLEKDFTSEYLNARVGESLAYLGLSSLFEKTILGYDESVDTRFRRKEALLNDLEKADETFTKAVDYENIPDSITKTPETAIQERIMMHMQAIDHCIDAVTFKHALDLACAKGDAEKIQEPDLAKVIESYGSVLKTYIENKKFNKKWVTDKLRILNRPLNDITSGSLEEMLSNYRISDELTLKHFQTLKDRISENKETSFLSMFEEGKRYGWFYVNSFIGGAVALPLLVAGAVAYVGSVVVAAKEGYFFSNYLVGGALGAATYLTYKYYSGAFNILNNLSLKVNQKLIKRNEKLKESVISRKKSFSEPLP